MRKIVFVRIILALLLSFYATIGWSQLADTPWPMLHHDPQHTRRSPYLGPQVANLKWSCKIGAFTQTGWNYSEPSIGLDGTIYIGCQDGNLYAVNPDGSVKWAHAADEAIYSTPAIGYDGTIYLGECHFGMDVMLGYLAAINPDGTSKWTRQIGDHVRMGPTIASDGTVYIASFHGGLHAINPDGTLKWIYTGIGIPSSPAIDPDGTIYVTSGGDLYAINPDGTLKWSYNTGDAYSYPAIGSDGTIYSATHHWLHAINPDGSLKWSYGAGFSSAAIGPDGTIYARAESLCAFNPNGTLKWSYDLGMDGSSPTVGSDGTIYIGVNAFISEYTPFQPGRFCAIDPDGTLKWSYEITESPSFSIIDSDGTLYVGTANTWAGYVLPGKLYAFEEPFAPVPGDNLWNIRANSDDRFHSNEAWLRPWRYDYDDGWGRWVGNYSYEVEWYQGPYTQGSGSLGGFDWYVDSNGNLTVNADRDRQWHAWTYVYVDTPKTLYIPGGGDCVPRVFLNYAFDNPIEFPGPLNLVAGCNRIDITGYNQNDGYGFNLNYALASNVETMNSTKCDNTPEGANVVVQPTDETTGMTPVTLTFDNVTEAGLTSLVTTDSGPPPPSGFALGDPSTYYDVTTTAIFSGSLQVCISYSGVAFDDESKLRLYHFEDTDMDGTPDTWVDNTLSLDTTNDIICASVNSLSPFAIFEPTELPVAIDIKPGSYPNSINLGSKGVIPVAVLSSEHFDAAQIDPGTVKLAGAGVAIRGKGNTLAHHEDVNGDGLPDLVVQVETENLDPSQFQDGYAELTGETYGGDQVIGSDEIIIVPPEAAPAELFEFDAPEPYPQPGNPEVWIPYKLAQSVEVNIAIHDTSGQLVRALALGYQPAGAYISKNQAAYWDGRNESGEQVSSGIYFYTIQAGGDFTATRKMVIAK